jgi:hypothetical protein
MSSAGKAALEYLKSINTSHSGDHLPDTQIWLVAVPGDASRESFMSSGVAQLAVLDASDVIEFASEWAGRRNLYYKGARFAMDAPGPQKAYARVFQYAWVDIDLVGKPRQAEARYIDMVVAALDSLVHRPSVIVATGGGVQALWHFDVPLVAGAGTVGSNGSGAPGVPGHVLIERINQELARVFAGDPAVCHCAGGLRLPCTANMNRGGAVAKVLRLEPGRTCKAGALLEELHGFGIKLSRTKDGAWSSVPAVLSTVERTHATEARAGALFQAGGANGSGGEPAKPAKSDAEWAEIKRQLVLKGGRNVAAAQVAGWLVRRGLSEDDAILNLLARSVEAADSVRAAGGKPAPLSQGELTTVVRSVMKTHERTGAGS